MSIPDRYLDPPAYAEAPEARCETGIMATPCEVCLVDEDVSHHSYRVVSNAAHHSPGANVPDLDICHACEAPRSPEGGRVCNTLNQLRWPDEADAYCPGCGVLIPEVPSL